MKNRKSITTYLLLIAGVIIFINILADRFFSGSILPPIKDIP